MVSGMASLVYLLSSRDLWELCVASMLLCCKGTARGNVTFYSALHWWQIQHTWLPELRHNEREMDFKTWAVTVCLTWRRYPEVQSVCWVMGVFLLKGAMCVTYGLHSCWKTEHNLQNVKKKQFWHHVKDVYLVCCKIFTDVSMIKLAPASALSRLIALLTHRKTHFI